MSQAKVTEFFATRKRNRHGAHEDLLIKQVKSADSNPPTNEKQTRSRTKKLEIDEAKKEQLALVKARITRLDAKLAKVTTTEPTEQVTNDNTEAVVKCPAKMRLNKAELKQKIEQFNKNLLLVQNEKAAEEEKAALSAKEKIPTQQVEDPKKETVQEEIPAFLKYKDLATNELDIATTLTLPKSYSLLLDSFKGSDTIVKFLFNRDELCTFLKLKMGIQNITKHTFTLKHLGQINTVYPQAYICKQEKLFVDFKNDYHLIISPNLEEIDVHPETGQRLFTPHVLLKRLAKFKINLFKIVKKFHQEFLESIGIKDISFEKIRRWHQKFDLENLKEIEATELPKPPIDESIKCKTGQELLNIAKDIYSSRIQEAIKKTVTKEETISLEITSDKSTTKVCKMLLATKSEVTSKNVASLEAPSNDAEVLNKLKEKKESSYNALLDKIRNKEKLKALESMALNTDKDKKMAKLKNCKEAVRFLAFFFQSEKKSTLELDKVVKKMSENLKGCLNELECREMLNEMASPTETILIENGKKWLNTIKVRNVLYLQMDKTFELNSLFSMVDKAIENVA